MSSIEERLARDIAAVTEGVVMTEADLHEAREELDQRIDRRGQRNRGRYIAVAAAAMILVVGGVTAWRVIDDPSAAPDPAGPVLPEMNASDRAWLTGDVVTEGLLEGVWRVDNGVVAVQFAADGTYRYDSSGNLFSDGNPPDATGTWTARGDLITLSNVSSDQAGCAGEQVRLWASTPKPGLVRLVGVPSDDPLCTPVGFGQQALEKVLPTNPDMTAFAAEIAREKGWDPLTDGSILDGIFFSGEGHLLELHADMTSAADGERGRYAVVSGKGDVVDRGEWQADTGRFILTSTTESPTCEAGDRLVLSAVEYGASGTLTFRGTTSRNDCGGAWTPASWIRIPDAGN